MKYCNTCGNLIPDRARKCRHCGANVTKNDQTDQPFAKYLEKYVEPQNKPNLKEQLMVKAQDPSYPTRKSIWFIFPFFIVPGIGLIYAGNKQKE